MMRRPFVSAALIAGLLGSAIASQASGRTLPRPHFSGREAGKKPRIMFYNDGRHPAIYMYEPPMQKEQFEAAVDELLGTPVEVLVYGLGDGRTVLHDTQVGEVVGRSGQEVAPPDIPPRPPKRQDDARRRGRTRCASFVSGPGLPAC